MRKIKTKSLGVRLLSGFLSVLMITSNCPMTAFADTIGETPTGTTTIVVDGSGVHIDDEEDSNSYTVDIESTEESNSEENQDLQNDETSSDISNDENSTDDEDVSDNQTEIESSNEIDVENEEETNDVADSKTDELTESENSTSESKPEDNISESENDISESENSTTESEYHDTVSGNDISDTENDTNDTEDDTIETKYTFVVTLPDDTTVNKDEMVEVSADIVATATVGEETKDVDYMFEFSCDGASIDNTSTTNATISFIEAGEYTVIGKLIVNDEVVASDEMMITVVEETEIENEYSITLPDDVVLSEGDTFDIVADVIATTTVEDETTDINYTVEFVCDDVNIETTSETSAKITFDKAGEYTIICNLIVDDEIVASDDIIVVVHPIVVFDHYFTTIDETLVETSDLLIKTSNPMVFTKNTNVVSNFDDVYIISCSSVEEARYVYSYYVDKVDAISDLSKVISIATNNNNTEDIADLNNLNNGIDTISQLNEVVENTETTDYSDYIALIDTGANADVNFSVIGDDTSDSNGHGTRMLELIKGENPNAKVMSIKVFNGDKTDAASVYAGIKLAIENNVKVINLSLVGADVEKNTIVKDVIQEAIDNNIVVIGAAGNYNLLANKFIPGCIEGVIVIGAANEDGTKKSISNYNADFYVVAESTSEATAIYTGLYTAGITEDPRVFTGDFNPTLHDPDKDDYYDGPDYFEIAIGEDVNKCDDFGEYDNVDLHSITEGQEFTGTCTFTPTTIGRGNCSNFTGDSIFTQIANKQLYVSCNSHWDNTKNSSGAKPMDAGTVYYKAVAHIEDITVGSVVPNDVRKITFDIDFSDDNNFTPLEWEHHTITYDVNIDRILSSTPTGYTSSEGVQYEYEVIYNVTINSTNPKDHYLPATGKLKGLTYSTKDNEVKNHAIGEFEKEIPTIVSGIVEEYLSEFSGRRIKKYPTGDRYNRIRAHEWISEYDTPKNDRHQVFHGRFSAWKYNYLYVTLNKTFSPISANGGLLSGSYKINDYTRLDLTTADGQPVKDINNLDVYIDGTANHAYNQQFVLYNYEEPGVHPDYSETSLTMTENSVGFGYSFGINSTNPTHKTDTKLTGVGNTNTVFSLANRPMYDPLVFRLRKISNNSGNNKPSGDISVNGAQYTLYGYTIGTNCEKESSTSWSHTYTSGNYYGIDGMINLGEIGSLSIGYYELKETKAPDGMRISDKVYSIYVLPNGCSPGNNNGQHYHTSNNVDIYMYEGSGHSGVEIYRQIKTDTGSATSTMKSNYTSQVNGFDILTLTESNDTFKNVDDEVWEPFGIIKIDKDLDNHNHVANTIASIAEGNGSYAGAQYQLFSTVNNNDYFQYQYNNPNGKGNNLSFGAGVTSVATKNGFDEAGTTNFSTTLYPVLYNGNPIIITTNANGYAETSMKFPYGDDYRFVEIKAPLGYQINTHLWSVSHNDWYVADANHKTTVTLSTYNNNENVAKITEDGNRDGAAGDLIYRYGFAFYKKDLTYSTDALNNTEGDGSLNGIRYAVINRSDHHIVMDSRYNTVDSAYVTIDSGKVIEKDQICAILTTHNDSAGREGYITMYGLPYGKYEIVELKRDAEAGTGCIGKVYDGNGMGRSTYANNSYLWNAADYPYTNDFSVDFTTETNKLRYRSTDIITTFTWNYAENNPDHIYQNKLFIDGFQGYKMDEEYLEVTEGTSNANEIRFAVINRSKKSVEILQSDIDKLMIVDPNWADYVDFIPGGRSMYGTGDTGAQIAPNHVVAVLTTHDSPTNGKISDDTVNAGVHTGEAVDGYFAIYGLPYGTYEVVELRRDAVVEPGDDWNSVNKGTSIYANDSFYWKNYSYTYELTDTDDATAHNDVVSALKKHNSAYAVKSDFQYQNEVFRDGFSFWKRDLVYHYTTDHPQGDSTWNDIRYVVVNRSDDEVKMFNKYTEMMPKSDQPYITIKDNVPISPNCVVAIITSHQKSNVAAEELTKGNEQGYVALFGLPYGTYDIYELRSDATIEVGDNYDSSTKLGHSPFANYETKSLLNSTKTEVNNHPSMLWKEDTFRYELMDTEDGLHKVLYDVNNLHTTTTDDRSEDTWDNETVYGDIIIHKIDRETNAPKTNQGNNKLSGVQFAVVNRSQWSISYPYNVETLGDATEEADRYFEPDEVIAVLETDENGECRIDHLPYGTYEIYELRINQSYCTDVRTIYLADSYGNGTSEIVEAYGNTIKPHFKWDAAAMQAYLHWEVDMANRAAGKDPNGCYFGNDDRANESYTWNEYIANYSVHEPSYTHNIDSKYSVHTEDDQVIRGWSGEYWNGDYNSDGSTNSNKGNYSSRALNVGPNYVTQTENYSWIDLPVRSDLQFQKANIDGDFMPYVPFIVSLVETDENGQPLQNSDGSYKVIEEHVIVLDFDGFFSSRNWETRPKTTSNVNAYDDKVKFDEELNKVVWTGTKEDLKAAASANIWFGNYESYKTTNQYLIKERGALLHGTYVIQEIPRVEKYGYPKTGEGSKEVVQLGNGQVRTIVWNTEDYDMISSTLKVVHDNQLLLPDDFDIGIDVPLTIKSEASDVITDSNSTLPSADGLLRDKVTFGGLNTSQKYAYKTYIYRMSEDGEVIEQLYESDMCVLDFTGDKWTDPDTNRDYNTLRNHDSDYEAPSYYSGTFITDNGSFTIVDNGYVVFRDENGNFLLESSPANDPTNDRFNVLYDLSVIQDFNVDTSSCQEGEKIAFSVDLYKSVGSTGWSLLKRHNEFQNEKTQDVGIIKFETESTDKTTRTRVAGLGGYTYDPVNGIDYPVVDNAAQTGNLVYNADGEIVGYTLVDDKIIYKNLADGKNYQFLVTLVDDDGNIVKDIYGNNCQTDLVAFYADRTLDHVINGTNVVYNNNTPEDPSDDRILQHSLEGPCDGEFTFSDFGLLDWIIPNNPNETKSLYIRTQLTVARGQNVKEHNYNMEAEAENIRWLQIDTTAMSEDGDQGILPNGRSWDLDGNMIKDDVILRDNIHYSNLAEPITIRVEGYVYLVGYKEDGTRFIDTDNGLDTPYVSYSTKKFDIEDVEGNVEMQYKIVDSGQYAKRQLVVCERVYMDLPGHAGEHSNGKYVPQPFETERRMYDIHNHYVQDFVTNDKYQLNDDGDTEVLIAIHEDINDEMQTVSVPEIETHLVNRHEDIDYKVISTTIADVTVIDTVTYRNLKVNEVWNFTAELMDQETKQPVLNADGQPVVAYATFTPTEKNSTIINGRAYGTIEVPIKFKQQITALNWESDPSWVCFETLRHGGHGSSEFKYAVHNNIYDERQTVHLPTFRTTIVKTVDDENIDTAVNATDRQLLAAPNQTVTDTVEIKNVGLDTVIKSTLTNADPTIVEFIPSTFTLKIAAFDVETGDPILDADGNQFTATKKIIVNAKFNQDGSITSYINDEANTGEVYFKQYNDGYTDYNVVLLGTDENPLVTDIDLTLDATNLKGKTIAFHETLYFDESTKAADEVLREDSNEHVEQMAVVPEIYTTAVDVATNEHTITVSGNDAESDEWYLNAEDIAEYHWMVKDTVVLNKITPNTDYTLVTMLMNKDTNMPVLNLADGSKFIKYTDYTSPEHSDNEIVCTCGKDGCVGVIAVNDTKDVILDLSGTDAKDGGTFVVYEYLILGHNDTYVPDETVDVPNDCYAYHNDIDDEEQTIVVPSIETEFLDTTTEIHVVPLETDATITDKVHYTGLVEGKSYTMQCVLMDKTTRLPLTDEDGNKFTQDVTFVAEADGEGDVLITFTISAELLHTFEETISENHVNPEDEPEIEGSVSGGDAESGNDTEDSNDESEDSNDESEDSTGSETESDENDTDNEDDEEIVDGREEKDLTDEDKERVSHGTRIVAFERCLSEDDFVVAIHTDIEDEDQTVLIPRIFTHLTDTVIGDHVSRWSKTETITDTVTFVSLQADKEYEMIGKLINVETGEPVLDENGEEIIASKKFIPNELPDTQVSISEGKLIASGNIDIEFVVDTTYLKGTHVVAFEDCYYNEIKVATHSDLTDEWQWSYIPNIGTILTDELTKDKVVAYGDTVTLIDKVEYDHILPGVWYEMSGTLMDKETGEPLLDKDGNEITATTRFMPAESSGEIDVVFTLDTTNLENTTIVAFEKCYYVGAKKDGEINEEHIAEHEDLEDEDQIVYVPKIRTVVKDANGNTNVRLDGRNWATITDTVTYENLVPGKEYTVTGKLVFKNDYVEGQTPNYVKDRSGNIITSSTTFVPEKPDGSVDVTLTFDASITAGKKTVVFEDLYYNGEAKEESDESDDSNKFKVRVATHSDINDASQSFDTSLLLNVRLVKSDFDNHQYNLKNAEITIYADKDCTVTLKDIYGNDCIARTDENGMVAFTIITYDENTLFYAKETKAPFGYRCCDQVVEIRAYHSYGDETVDEVTVESSHVGPGVEAINLKMFDKIIIIPPKTGDNLPILPILLITLLGLLCVGMYFALRQKVKVSEVDSSTIVEETDDKAKESLISMVKTDVDIGNHEDTNQTNIKIDASTNIDIGNQQDNSNSSVYSHIDDGINHADGNKRFNNNKPPIDNGKSFINGNIPPNNVDKSNISSDTQTINEDISHNKETPPNGEKSEAADSDDDPVNGRDPNDST